MSLVTPVIAQQSPGYLLYGTAKIDDRSYILPSAIWPTPAIPVCWEKLADSKPEDRAIVRSALKLTWEFYSNVQFIGWVECAPAAEGVRIRVADEADGPRLNCHPSKGCLGQNINAMPNSLVFNFTFEKWGEICISKRELCIHNIAVHEFGHVLAFAHEQNRSDTPGECALFRQGTNGTLMLTPWDPLSVMNYCFDPEYKRKWELSKFDIAAVQKFYQKRKGPR